MWVQMQCEQAGKYMGYKIYINFSADKLFIDNQLIICFNKVLFIGGVLSAIPNFCRVVCIVKRISDKILELLIVGLRRHFAMEELIGVSATVKILQLGSHIDQVLLLLHLGAVKLQKAVQYISGRVALASNLFVFLLRIIHQHDFTVCVVHLCRRVYKLDLCLDRLYFLLDEDINSSSLLLGSVVLQVNHVSVMEHVGEQ